MFAIVLGAGLFGKRMIELLVEKGWKVLVIEKDAEIAEKITEEYGVSAVHGDGTDPRILEEAGIEKADVFIGATSKESVNMLAAVIAREYGVNRIVVRVSKNSYVSLLRKIGMDCIVIPEEIAADYVFSQIAHPAIRKVMKLSDGLCLIVIEVTKDINVVGKKLVEVKADEFKAIAIIKGKKILASEKSLIKEGDLLLIVSFTEPEKILKKLI